MNYYIEQTNELMHYGVPGMKWGVRRNRVDSTSSTSAKKIAREIDKDFAIFQDYLKATKTYGRNSEQGVAARKRVNEQEKRLRKQVIDYLEPLSKQEVGNLVKFDVEHGRHYVEYKVFDKKWNDYVEGIYID